MTQHAQEICVQIVAILREINYNTDQTLEFATLALKLPSSKTPAKLLSKLLLILKPITDADIVAAAKHLNKIKHSLKNATPNPQLVDLANTAVDASGETFMSVGQADYVSDAAASAVLQQEYMRAKLHQADNIKYDIPKYDGSAEAAVTHYKLDNLLEQKKTELLNLANKLLPTHKSKVANDSATPTAALPPTTSLLDITKTLTTIIANIKQSEIDELTDSLKTELHQLNSPPYRKDTMAGILTKTKQVLPYKSEVKARHILKKNIARSLALLADAIAEPLPKPPTMTNKSSTIDANASLEQHYTQLQTYLSGEYAKLPWLQELERHMFGLADLCESVLIQFAKLITDDNHFADIKKLYITLLQLQILKKMEKCDQCETLLLQHFNKFPKLCIDGQISRIKI